MDQTCHNCGKLISYQRYKAGGLCQRCEDRGGYTRSARVVPPGLYAMVKMSDSGEPVLMDNQPVLYSNDMLTALQEDRLRIGQVVERWVPGSDRGELLTVAYDPGKDKLILKGGAA